MKTPFQQVNKFNEPKHITQPADQFGCVGFTSYGFVQDFAGEIHHVKTPDFNWRKAYAQRMVRREEFPAENNAWV